MVMTRLFLQEVRAESCLLPLNPPQGQARAGATQLGLGVEPYCAKRTRSKKVGATSPPILCILSVSFPVIPGPQKS